MPPRRSPQRTQAKRQIRRVNPDQMRGPEVKKVVRSAASRKSPSASLLAKGLNAKKLNERGIYPSTLLKMGFSLAEVKRLGYTARDVRNTTGKHTWDLKQAGYSAPALRAAGYQIADIINLGRSRYNGYTLKQLKAAGCTAGELKRLGNYSARALKKAGYPPREIQIAYGYDPRALKKLGFTVTELKNSGLNKKELIWAGFSPAEVNAAFRKK